VKKKRFSVEQIVSVLREAAAGAKVLDLVSQARHLGRHVLELEG
jgi:hypothetical protein